MWTHRSPRGRCHGCFAHGQNQFGTDALQAVFSAGCLFWQASLFWFAAGDSLMARWLAQCVAGAVWWCAGWVVGRWSADWRLLSRLAFDTLAWLCMLCISNLLYSTLRLQGWSVAAFPPDSPNQLQHGQSAESHQPPNRSELATLPI